MKIKEVDVSLGLSVEINKTWYKLTSRRVAEMDAEEVESGVERKKAVQNLWDEATNDIAKQITELQK